MTDAAIAIILLATVALVAALWYFIWRHKERKPLAVIAINSLYRLSQIVYAWPAPPIARMSPTSARCWTSRQTIARSTRKLRGKHENH